MSAGYSRRRRPAIYTPEPVLSGHSATARDPAVIEAAGPSESDLSHGHGLYKPDTASSVSRCGPAPGSVCSASAPRPWPLCATNGLGPTPSSVSHVLRNSSAYRISCSWQHHSQAGPEVLHLELEPKENLPSSGIKGILMGEAK